MDRLGDAIRTRDLAQIRDLLLNWTPPSVAAVIKDLSIEDQVVVFRVLPRASAAAVFEFLERDQQEKLLKAMGREEVAAILNSMAPDDRTVLLDELPA